MENNQSVNKSSIPSINHSFVEHQSEDESFIQSKSMSCLPNEVLHKIFSFLSWKDFGNMRSVCHSFQNITESVLHRMFNTGRYSVIIFDDGSNCDCEKEDSKEDFCEMAKIGGKYIPTLLIPLYADHIDVPFIETYLPLFSNIQDLYIELGNVSDLDDKKYSEYVRAMETIMEIVSQCGHSLEYLSIKGIPFSSINLAPFINLENLCLVYSPLSFQASIYDINQPRMSNKITPWSVHNQSELHKLKSVSIFNGKYSNGEDDSTFFINLQSVEELHLFQSGFPINHVKEMAISMNKLTSLTLDCCLESSMALLKHLATSTKSVVKNNLKVLYIKSNLNSNQSSEILSILSKFINLSELGILLFKVSSSDAFKEIVHSCIQLKHFTMFRCEIILSPVHVLESFQSIISMLDSFSCLDCSGLSLESLKEVLLSLPVKNPKLKVVLDEEQFQTPFNLYHQYDDLSTYIFEEFLYFARHAHPLLPSDKLILEELRENDHFELVVFKQELYWERVKLSTEDHPSFNKLNMIISLYYINRLQAPKNEVQLYID